MKTFTMFGTVSTYSADLVDEDEIAEFIKECLEKVGLGCEISVEQFENE